MYKWTAGKGAVGWQKRRGSPISVAEVHILKFNLALLKAKGPCSRKVLNLGECHQCVPPLRAWYSPVIRNTMQVSASQNHTPLQLNGPQCLAAPQTPQAMACSLASSRS